jgi:archaellum component FlaF (FlaF/FlaG flagellin family)
MILKWISGKLTYILGGVIVMLLVTVLSLGALYSKQVELTTKVESKVEMLEKVVDNLNTQIKVEQAKHKSLNEKTSENTQKFIDKGRELNNFKGREHVLAAKPKLTEKKINNSFDDFMIDLSCITGDKTACTKQ